MEFRQVTLEQCADVGGVVVVVDVLRAFTTAAVAFAGGADAIVLVSGVGEAFALREQVPDLLLMGEVGGLPVAGFDLPNSPSSLHPADLASRTIVLRTTAGTQGMVRAARARTLYAASLCVASATARAVAGLEPDVVTFVVTGVRGAGRGDEDVACADYISGLLTGEGPSRQEVEHRVRASVAARTLTGAPGEDRPAADVDRALDFDAFPFAMRAGREGPQLVLRAQPMIIEDIA